MIPIPPIVLKLGTYVLILSTAWLHGCHYGKSMGEAEFFRLKTEYQIFTDKTRAAGEAAQKQADAQKALDEQRRAASDASYAKALGVLGRDIGELRKRTSSGAYDLPAPNAPTAQCAEGLRCFSREEFDRALREFETATDGFVAEGAALNLQLTTAIDWAKAR